MSCGLCAVSDPQQHSLDGSLDASPYRCTLEQSSRARDPEPFAGVFVAEHERVVEDIHKGRQSVYVVLYGSSGLPYLGVITELILLM